MTKKAVKTLEWSIIGFLLILLGVSASLFFYQRAYAGKIYKNVFVEDINLSGLNKKQAAALIEKKFQNSTDKEIAIKTDNKEIKVLMKDIGLTIDSKSIVNDCYDIGRDNSFLKQLYVSGATFLYKNSIKIEPTIDEQKYEQFKKIAIEQLNFEPKDAQLIIENGQIKETEGLNGQMVEIDDLPSQIISLTQGNNLTIQLVSNTVTPNVTTANFAEAKTQAEVILNRNITFTYEDKNYTPTRQEIGLWVDFKNDKGKITTALNENNMRAYLNKISKNVEIQKRDKKVNANDGNVIDPGQEGKYVDKNVAVSQIKNQIYTTAPIKIILATYTEAPAEIKVFPSEGLVPGRFEGKYIDVDLTNQKLCKVESTTVLECFIISSGKPGMPTPTGTFKITGKNSKQWSRKYGLWMPWWQQFSGDYGLHELPEWPNGYKEGESHLGHPVSHGCVRLGIGAAENVYNWTEIGTPVFIHK